MGTRLVSLTALLLLALPIGATTQTPEPEAQRASAEARWKANRPAAYEFTLKAICFCPPDSQGDPVFRVSKGNSSLIRGRVRFGPLEGRNRDQYDTIDGLFSWIREILKSRPSSVEIEYDPMFGFPRRVFVDPEELIADEEYGFTVEMFTPLPQ